MPTLLFQIIYGPIDILAYMYEMEATSLALLANVFLANICLKQVIILSLIDVVLSNVLVCVEFIRRTATSASIILKAAGPPKVNSDH